MSNFWACLASTRVLTRAPAVKAISRYASTKASMLEIRAPSPLVTNQFITNYSQDKISIKAAQCKKFGMVAKTWRCHSSQMTCWPRRWSTNTSSPRWRSYSNIASANTRRSTSQSWIETRNCLQSRTALWYLRWSQQNRHLTCHQ